MRSINKRGFTLIETLIYIAVIGLISGSFVAFGSSVSSARNKTYAAQEVQSNVRFALEIISNQIRSSSGINVPASVWNANNGKLVLTNAELNKNPAIIDLDEEGRLRLKLGSADPIFLTSPRVKVDRLYFYNFSNENERENIGLEMSVVYRQEASSAEFGFRQDVKTAVSVRQ